MSLNELQSQIRDQNEGPLRILLVDDEPSTLQLVRKVLQADGHEISEAVDGEQAIEVFNRVKPDLVLLDIVIPKMDGLSVLREFRILDQISGVIMVSALSSEELAVKSMLAGADDYVSKPFKLKTIRMNIRQVMEKVRLRRNNARLQAEVDKANATLQEIFKLYVPPGLAEKLLSNPALPKLGGERKNITIMFMDICDFTPLSQQLPPDQVLLILNQVLAMVTDPVPENGGYLDKIMGDGFMAIFQADEDEHHATRAIRSAISMVHSISRWNEQSDRPINISVGIHTGDAVVGNIGTEDMMNYTAIGDSVNLAKRIQESSDDGQVLISEGTFAHAETGTLNAELIHIESLGPRSFKGLSNAIKVYTVSNSTSI